MLGGEEPSDEGVVERDPLEPKMEEALESGSAQGDSEPDDEEKDEHEADCVVAYDELERNESVE